MEGWWHLAQLQLLVIDADPQQAALTRQLLNATEPGIRVTTVARLTAALDALRTPSVSCVVTDLQLQDAEGVRVVRALRAARPDVPVVVATATGSEDLAVAVMKLGAADYLCKPAGLGRLVGAVREALGRAVLAGLEEPSRPLDPPAAGGAEGDFMVATTASMRHVMDLVGRASHSSVPVLLEGETGTGKELIARAIHQAGPRRAAPFVVQNCAALPEALLESELFGHLRGAFTGADRHRRGLFAEAGDGTVFLDEIGEAPPVVQAKLLRVLQSGEVKAVGADRADLTRARVVAATNRPLEAEVAAGRFRGDLYYRLVVFPIRVPPLRHRAAEVPHLLEHFLRRFELEESRATGGFGTDALGVLQAYPWPGNVRELEHEVHRLVLTVAPGQRIRRLHVARRIREAAGGRHDESLARVLARVELALLRQRVARHATKAAAARSLGISREGLHAKLRRLGALED